MQSAQLENVHSVKSNATINMDAERSVNADHVPMSENHVRSTVNTVTFESNFMVVKLNANVAHVDQLNVQNDVTGVTSDVSDINALGAVDARNANQPNVHVFADGVTRSADVMAASENVGAKHVNQLGVQNYATGDTSRNTNTDVASDVLANLVRMLNARRDVNMVVS